MHQQILASGLILALPPARGSSSETAKDSYTPSRTAMTLQARLRVEVRLFSTPLIPSRVCKQQWPLWSRGKQAVLLPEACHLSCSRTADTSHSLHSYSLMFTLKWVRPILVAVAASLQKASGSFWSPVSSKSFALRNRDGFVQGVTSLVPTADRQLQRELLHLGYVFPARRESTFDVAEKRNNHIAAWYLCWSTCLVPSSSV